MKILRQRMFISPIAKPETVEVVKSLGSTIKPMPGSVPNKAIPKNPDFQTANKENQLKLQQQKIVEERQKLAEQKKTLDEKNKLLNLNITNENRQTTFTY